MKRQVPSSCPTASKPDREAKGMYVHPAQSTQLGPEASVKRRSSGSFLERYCAFFAAVTIHSTPWVLDSSKKLSRSMAMWWWGRVGSESFRWHSDEVTGHQGETHSDGGNSATGSEELDALSDRLHTAYGDVFTSPNGGSHPFSSFAQ